MNTFENEADALAGVTGTGLQASGQSQELKKIEPAGKINISNQLQELVDTERLNASDLIDITKKTIDKLFEEGGEKFIDSAKVTNSGVKNVIELYKVRLQMQSLKYKALLLAAEENKNNDNKRTT